MQINRTIYLQLLLNEYNDKIVTMISHSLDPGKIQKMRNRSLQLSSWQFVKPLWCFSFERNARWNLNLSSRFTIANQRRKKRTKSRKLRSMNDRNNHFPYMYRISNTMFVSKLRNRDRGIRKIDKRNQRNE